jgi:DNA-binding NarL/FixJ family response regulator
LVIVELQSPQTIRVLLADDHEWVREGLRVLFERLPAFEVVEDAGNRSAAVDAANELSPDVVVMDLSTPDGLSALRRLKERRPDIAAVVLGQHRDSAHAREALDAGASGYVLRQSTFGVLVRAVEAAAQGRRHVDQGVAEAPPDRTRQLTDRETSVLRQAVAGRTNKDIASALGISAKTVEVHKFNGMHKLGLKDRRQLLRFGLQHGWLADV